MNQKKTLTLMVLFVLLANYAFAKEPTCLEQAMTQPEMNECAGMDYVMADGELNRIYAAVQSRYAEDKLFLKKLKKAQLAWIKLRDADFEMQFPHAKDPAYYGRMFSTCADSYKTELTLQRVAFLKQWLIGVEEGDSCAGSKQYAMSEPIRQVEENDEVTEMCYIASEGYDPAYQDILELRLSVNYGDGTVKGSYDYLPAGKDQRLGQIDGSLWKGAISAKYTFEQEGQKDMANLRIELDDGKAIIKSEAKDRMLGLDAKLKKIDCGA